MSSGTRIATRKAPWALVGITLDDEDLGSIPPNKEFLTHFDVDERGIDGALATP
jgi:hypothetical protein